MVAFGIAVYWSANENSLEDQFLDAMKAFDSGDLGPLLVTADSFRGAEGYEPHLHLMEGMLLLSSRRPGEALRELGGAYEHEDTRVRAYALTGAVLYQMKRFVEAEQALSRAVKLDPSQLESRRLLAATYYDIGAMRQAVFHLLEIAKQAPDDPRPHRLMGLINKDYEKYEDAIAAYRESLRRGLEQPEKNEVQAELAECLIELLKYEEALEALRNSLPSASVLTLKARCHFDQQDLDKAESLVERSIELDPDYLPAMLLKGRLALETDRASEAVEILAQAVELSPGDFQAHFQLAKAYQAVGQKEFAEKHFERMQELRALRERFSKLHTLAVDNPQDAELRYQLGVVAVELGKPELARTWFVATLGLNPKHTGALKALQENRLLPASN